MRAFELSRWAKARVWRDREPLEMIGSSATSRRTVDAVRSEATSDRLVAVEAYIPVGGRAEYALLGARFLPKDSKSLQIVVPSSSDLGRRWEGGLASSVDEISLGLPTEYQPTVLDTLAARASNRLPPGELRVVCAAYGRVGSNQSVFARVSGVLIELMLLPDGESSEAQMLELLRNELLHGHT
jgi:hypothetical protein